MPSLRTPVRSQELSTRCRRVLLAWFRRNARPLPWRETKDPYRVWISEVMLQQTQMATVIPYYRRFLRAFPTVRHLARAPLERVLELWSGLGYYRRARHLHSAARQIVREFGGRFPRDFDAMGSLPGIGRYTAGAVLSIAYNLPYFALDGNVARVVARVEARRGNLHQPGFRRLVEAQLELMLSRRRPGDFNQALMEIGETLCLPRAPRCPACPLRRSCAAYRAGNPEDYPAPRPRRATEAHYLAAGVILRDLLPNPESPTPKPVSVAMVRGLDEGLLGDLWNFPSALGRTPEEARLRLRRKLGSLFGAPIRCGKPLARLHHRITYRSITVDLYPAGNLGRVGGNSIGWFRPAELSQAAISELARKIILALDNRHGLV